MLTDRRVVGCPGCHAPMRLLVLERRPLGNVEVDLCPQCRGLWFDAFESVQLAPEATLALFREVAALSAAQPASVSGTPRCPRCRERLAETRDVQRTTRFSYWRCRSGHGRFTPFVQFMREKDFVRPLSPPEIERVRAQIGTVRCSGCGAPVDLGREPSCRYCGARIEALDADAIRTALAAHDASAATIRPAGRPDGAIDAWLESQRRHRMHDRTWTADLVTGGLAMLLEVLDNDRG